MLDIRNKNDTNMNQNTILIVLRVIADFALIVCMFIWLPFIFIRTKYEVRDKQQQSRITTLEKEKKSLQDELTSTVNELTKVRGVFHSILLTIIDNISSCSN